MFSRLPREGWLILTIIALTIGVHALATRGRITSPSDFLSPRNMQGIAKDTAMLGIFALGAGIIIIAGGIDLSSGSVICFAGFVAAKTPEWIGYEGTGPFPSWLIGLMMGNAILLGTFIGIFHGVLIHHLGLPPFVATLGTMAGLRSLASVVGSATISVSDPGFRTFGKTWYVPVIILLVEAVLLFMVIRWMRVGRHIEAMGGNEEAARLSGLPIGRLKLFAYVIGAVTASLAGLVYLGHSGGVSSNTATGYELSAIAASVVGGCNLKGGAGSLVGILLGCFLLKLVTNIPLYVIETGATDWEGLIVGGVVILAVMLGRLGNAGSTKGT
ncbi:ABC transporter permease [bacterium]|nr:ABC transporter permease [bacterium]